MNLASIWESHHFLLAYGTNGLAAPMIYGAQLLQYLIRPTLDWMGETAGERDKFSRPHADILLLATSAQESHCGEYLHQVGGPALGIMQVEPRTHRLVRGWAQDHGLGALVAGERGDDRLIYDLRYAVTIARLLYYSWPDALPDANAESCYAIYKKCYNSAKGAATFEQFSGNWSRYVEPVL